MSVLPAARRLDQPARRPARAATFAEIGWAALALVAAAVLTGYRLNAVRKATYPGHADPAFFYNVAQNIHAGKGQTVDYVWHFLVPQDHLNHYAFDYWLPMPSWLMALGLKTGNGITGAIDVGILLSVVMAIAVYAVIRELTHSAWAPALGAMVALVQPGVSNYVVQTESAIYLAAFAVAAITAAVYARRITGMWIVAGIFTALAGMSRSEGLLLTIAMGVSALAWSGRSRWYRRVGLLLAGYLPFIAYFWWENLRHFGSLFPPASGAFPYITSYEQIFATHIPHSVSALLGGHGLRYYVSSRVHAFSLLPGILQRDTTTVSLAVLLLLVGAGIGRARATAVLARAGFEPEPATASDEPGSVASAEEPARVSTVDVPGSTSAAADDQRWYRRLYQHGGLRTGLRSVWLLPGLYAALMLLLDGELAPLVQGGAALKSFLSLVVLIVVAGVVGLTRLRPAWWLTAIVALVLVVGPLGTLRAITHNVITVNNKTGTNSLAYAKELQSEQACLNRPLVLMTRGPWEITQATGFATVQMPDGSLADIMAVVRKYGVTDVLSPSVRPALAAAVKLVDSGGPLAHSPELPHSGIYRFREMTQGAHC